MGGGGEVGRVKDAMSGLQLLRSGRSCGERGGGGDGRGGKWAGSKMPCLVCSY